MPTPVIGAIGAIGSIGGSYLSGRANRKAMAGQNAANEATYLRQVAAEREMAEYNRFGVFTGLNRGWEQYVQTPMQRLMNQGGIGTEATQLGLTINSKQALIDSLDAEDLSSLKTDAERDARQEEIDAQKRGLGAEIEALQREKYQIESGAIARESAKFDPMQDAAVGTAGSIYDGSLLSDRLTSMQEGQDLLSSMSGIRGDYAGQIDAAGNAIYDPSQYGGIYDARAQLARSQDSPEYRQMMLDSIRDRSAIEPLQAHRLTRALDMDSPEYREMMIARASDRSALIPSQEARISRAQQMDSPEMRALRAEQVADRGFVDPLMKSRMERAELKNDPAYRQMMVDQVSDRSVITSMQQAEMERAQIQNDPAYRQMMVDSASDRKYIAPLQQSVIERAGLQDDPEYRQMMTEVSDREFVDPRQQAFLEQAQAQDSQRVRDLMMSGATDRGVVDQQQQLRRDMAEATAAGVQEEALRAGKQASAGRTYGGSSLAQLRALGGISMDANRATAQARLSAQRTNLAQDEALRREGISSEMAAIQNQIANQSLVRQAGIANLSEDEALRREGLSARMAASLDRRRAQDIGKMAEQQNLMQNQQMLRDTYGAQMTANIDERRALDLAKQAQLQNLYQDQGMLTNRYGAQMAANLDERGALDAAKAAEQQNILQNQALQDQGYSVRMANIQDAIRNRDLVNQARARNLGEDQTVLQNTYDAQLAAMQNQIASRDLVNQATEKNLLEDRSLQEADWRAQMSAKLNELQAQRGIQQANLQTQQQQYGATRDYNQNILNQILSRKDDALLGTREQIQIAGDKDRARAAAQQMRLSNIGLPQQMRAQALSDLVGNEQAMQALYAIRSQPMNISNIGSGNLQAPAVPVPQIAVNNTWGNMASTLGGAAMQYGMGQIAHDRNMALQKQYLNRAYPRQGGGGGSMPAYAAGPGGAPHAQIGGNFGPAYSADPYGGGLQPNRILDSQKQTLTGQLNFRQ